MKKGLGEQASQSHRSLLSLLAISIILSVFFAFVYISVSSAGQQMIPINYAGYQIQESSVATITLSYSFPESSGIGILNLTTFSSLGIFTAHKSYMDYTTCGVVFNGSLQRCGLSITPSKLEMNYYPLYNTTITFTAVTSSSGAGDYLFSPAGGGGSGCGYSISLIVGDEFPNKLPTLISLDCNFNNNMPVANISVISFQNMAGFITPN